MKIYAPNYYPKFKCKADRCQNSCCIGWEIDIDEETLKKYDSVKGELGDRLRDGISYDGEAPHFKLDEKERCPYLNDKGLCDIIIEMGEEALCNICADHPRYRNFFSDRTEIGVGMSCEAAAELIVSQEKKAFMTVIGDGLDTADNGEKEADQADIALFEIRRRVIDILQNRSVSILKRLRDAQAEQGVVEELSIEEVKSIFSDLEYMDKNNRRLLLSSLECGCDGAISDEISVALEQIAVYFIYRHLADAVYDGAVTERTVFACISAEIIAKMFFYRLNKLNERAVDMKALMADTARRYSAEIEYSEENIGRILDEIAERAYRLS